MMHRIEYLLKHNKFIQGTYVFLFSLLFKFLGIFVRPNKKRIIFQSLIGKNYGDSIKVLYDSIRNNPEFEGYQYVWAFDEPDKFEVDGAKKVKLNSINYYM